MSTPALAPEVAREASRTLLERLHEKTQLVKFFRHNACAKHGVPIEPEREFDLEPAAAPVPNANPTPTPTPTPTQQPVATQPAAQKANWMVPLAVCGLGAGFAALTVASAYALLAGDGDKEEQQQPAVTAPAQPGTGVYRQSPYQFIEDSGEHMP